VIPFTFILFVLLFAAFCLQQWVSVPATLFAELTGDFLHGGDLLARGRMLLIPATFYCAALAVSFPVMLALALWAGLLWDAGNALVIEEMNYSTFGAGIFLFGLTGALMQGVRPLFVSDRWVLPVVFVGIAVILFLLMEYLLIGFRKGQIEFPAVLWTKIISSGMLTLMVAPLIMLGMRGLAHWTGYIYNREGLLE